MLDTGNGNSNVYIQSDGYFLTQTQTHSHRIKKVYLVYPATHHYWTLLSKLSCILLYYSQLQSNKCKSFLKEWLNVLAVVEED